MVKTLKYNRIVSEFKSYLKGLNKIDFLDEYDNDSLYLDALNDVWVFSMHHNDCEIYINEQDILQFYLPSDIKKEIINEMFNKDNYKCKFL